MNSLNQLILEGKCTGVRNTYGNAVCFDVAATRDGETTVFPVFAYGKLASAVSANITDGTKVRLVGRLTRTKWTDGTGKKQAGISIVAEHIDFMGGK